ncbi:hypothetical protein NEHOM01_2393 [Nematocida homosporus]|uniref:uncharacterized protein n=1 Tax=Nematocida homosporus TaxID=1912981 RepID=UPI002220E7B1|nr:uncharacterized protein NEHOM01_2393 [Nematocida homosporus]KAI5187821.1 hypothetical protein NEHOM01_2393 [Nematocida homosporus]
MLNVKLNCIWLQLGWVMAMFIMELAGVDDNTDAIQQEVDNLHLCSSASTDSRSSDDESSRNSSRLVAILKAFGIINESEGRANYTLTKLECRPASLGYTNWELIFNSENTEDTKNTCDLTLTFDIATQTRIDQLKTVNKQESTNQREAMITKEVGHLEFLGTATNKESKAVQAFLDLLQVTQPLKINIRWCDHTMWETRTARANIEIVNASIRVWIEEDLDTWVPVFEEIERKHCLPVIRPSLELSNALDVSMRSR